MEIMQIRSKHYNGWYMYSKRRLWRYI